MKPLNHFIISIWYKSTGARMADTLHKKEQNLYYYRKESGMELDFLIDYKRECVPVEVKAKTAKAKSISTALKHPEKYDVYHAIKFGDYNIGRDGQLLTLPNYMQFLLDLEPEEIILEPCCVMFCFSPFYLIMS